MIPRVQDLTSAPMTHRFGDIFNPPGLTNFLGCVQVDVDPTAIRSLNFPPFACSDSVTASLFVDGRYFRALGVPVTTTWRPDRIVREAEFDGLRLTSTTALAVEQMAAMVQLEVRNISGVERDVRLRLGMIGAVTRVLAAWTQPLPPWESDNDVVADRARSAFVFHARHSAAVNVQGTWPLADEFDSNGLGFHLALRPGATRDHAVTLFERLVRDVPGELERARADWDEELSAVFTPGNTRYSGSLPVLETADDDIRRLYHTGVLGVVYFKRESPYSVLGRTYDTLMPRYWQSVTFLWDYSLSSPIHAVLDPLVMRRYLDHWMGTDVHGHMGTEWLTGAGVGMWYSVNDFAMTRIAREYLRWNGDLDWLEQPVVRRGGNAVRVLDELVGYARSWEQFRTAGGLADYGGIGNLLECVSTYVHEVASLNAANVASLRATAELLDLVRDPATAATMRADADALVERVQALYVQGDGFWNARTPDGQLVPVRHCYDLLTMLTVMADDLKPEQRDEMIAFFRRELQTPTWMRALSDRDTNAPYSVRPDHQWNGAYTAWPSETAAGLYRVGAVDVAFEWLKGLARSANQGPFGQAHFVEDVVEPESGGARKASPEMPYINDWACASGGSWANLVIGSIFGVNAFLDGTLYAVPQFGRFDPDARLLNMPHRGRLYDVTRDGLRPASS